MYQQLGERSCVNMAFCFELNNTKYFPVVKRQGAADQSVQFVVSYISVAYVYFCMVLTDVCPVSIYSSSAL